ncbi:MEK kinase (MEKK) Mkh1 [Schizosaccharomyces pombe]|uniref:MAP kinase kinase kinase mkh1 n=1 Tax=Schizosaccharomyces pombe (strain 972 / ATCC 24843) TaxID=284812 RepID=MKH1_SCHPO|nr:MEK kinase (MEKK) Mkh1 [Schizosaccharomyces pombe]Q10407.1 RecName: Full=MAP kinase kinase kinase mkh1 [Schizosaccharomyces pombe 972h-]AAB62319.1 Mkh1 [Schizosaccharomyces pombe]CAA94620.1 MEK kinase (MEKK) Mkh1 [Schizosaccharomyces pombe]|eukprot:NP_593005.1 MEK kinase (MEKK) Mkh1 [Schizosaccharomyces pombe]
MAADIGSQSSGSLEERFEQSLHLQNVDKQDWSLNSVLQFLKLYKFNKEWEDVFIKSRIEMDLFINLADQSKAEEFAFKNKLSKESAIQLSSCIRKTLLAPSSTRVPSKNSSYETLTYSAKDSSDDVFTETNSGFRSSNQNSSLKSFQSVPDSNVNVFGGFGGSVVDNNELLSTGKNSHQTTSLNLEGSPINLHAYKGTVTSIINDDSRNINKKTLSKQPVSEHKEKQTSFLRRFRVPGFSRDKDKTKDCPSSNSNPFHLASSNVKTLDASLDQGEWVPRIHRLESQIGLISKKKSFVLATMDDMKFTVVDITNVQNATQLRKLIAKSMYLDISIDQFDLFLTEVGGAQYIEILDDRKLDIARLYSDEFGTIKFFVKPSQNEESGMDSDTYLSFGTKSSSTYKADDDSIYHRKEDFKKQPSYPVLTSDFEITDAGPNLSLSGHQPDNKYYKGFSSAPNLAVVPELPSRRFRGFEKIRGAKGEMATKILDATEAQSEKNKFTVCRPHKKVTLKMPLNSGSSAPQSPSSNTSASVLTRNFVAHRDPPPPPTETSSLRRKNTLTRRPSIRHARSSPYIDTGHNEASKFSHTSFDPKASSKSSNSLKESVEALSEIPFEDAPALDESDLSGDPFWAIQPKQSSSQVPKENHHNIQSKLSINTEAATDLKANELSSPKTPEYCRGDDRSISLSPLSYRLRKSKHIRESPPSSKVINSGNWEVRPSADDLYEDVDRFFPRYDLDKVLVVDQSRMVSSPSKVSIRPKMKSVRLLAREASEARKEIRHNARRNKSGNLLRRSSTKLWGSRIVELKPDTTITSGSVVSQNATFKWMKGELIGNGTYGKVFLAMNINTGELIAVKQVEIPQTINGRHDQLRKDIVDSINAEISMIADLDHLNIVQYLGFEKTETDISIFLEYVSGGSIGRCLRNYGPFEEQLVRFVSRQVLYGLSYLHSKGIIHRDLKADNLLIDFDGVCKISDFGISKHSDNVYDNDANLSMQGSIFWMAPEVIHNDHQGYSAKVDVWSLGCVVLEMLAGRRPWSTDEAIQAMFKLGTEKKAPPIPSELVSQVSPEAIQFLNACFTVNADVRPTAEELLNHPFMKCDEEFNFKDTNLYDMLCKRKS